MTFPARRHGLYTYYLIKGLREAAEKGEAVTAGSLHEYARGEVSRISGRLAQEPLLRGQSATSLLERPEGGR